jgi:hypothetical protein
MAANRSPQRHRQRSVRATVSVALLAIATAIVVAALTVWTSAAPKALVAVLILGWSALRVMWREVVASRHEHAADRAQLARGYQSLAARRSAEHSAYVSRMAERLATSHQTLGEMTGAARTAQQLAAQLERQVMNERQRADENATRIGQLETLIRNLATTPYSSDPELDSLLAFEERVRRASTGETETRKLA